MMVVTCALCAIALAMTICGKYVEKAESTLKAKLRRIADFRYIGQ